MSVDRTELAQIFPGQWDGRDQEFHGLVRAKGSQLRIECLLRDETWTASIFKGGQTLTTATDPDVRRAIATALKDALRAL